jgi:uncharacterized protein (TIGR02265 family)
MMSSNAPIVRGSLFLGIRAWLKAELSSTEMKSFLRRLQPPVARLVTERVVINQSEIPAADFCSLCDAVIEAWGLDGPRGLHTIVGRVAVSDLGGHMRILMRIGTPRFVLSRFPRVWRNYFSHGELTVEEDGERAALVCIRDAGAYGRVVVEGSYAWMLAALKCAGAKDVKLTRRSVSDPNNLAFAIQWK